VIRVNERDNLIAKLGEANIGTGIHYPIPLHLQKAYQCLGYKQGDFPVSERLASEIVSLPMYPNLIEEQQHRVCDRLREIFFERAASKKQQPALTTS
jgi:dTDP-4-amino-4,6-dideoxygalactose transaminase